MAKTCMGQLMGDDRLDGAQVSLHGREVAATCVDIHASASRELTGFGVVVGDVLVVRVVVVEHDKNVVAPLRYMGNTIKDAYDSLKRLVDERKRGLGDVPLHRRVGFAQATLENCLHAIAAAITLFCVRYSPLVLELGQGSLSGIFRQHFAVRLKNSDPTSFYTPHIVVPPDWSGTALSWGGMEQRVSAWTSKPLIV